MLLDWPIRRGLKPATTATNKEIWKAFALEDPAFVEQIDQCQNWRNEYPKMVELAVRLQVETAGSNEKMWEMCRAGLQKAHELFVVRCDSSENVLTPHQAMAGAGSNTNPRLQTNTYIGSQPDPNDGCRYQFRLASPRTGTDDDEPIIWLRGDAATLQLNAWKTYGCLEPSAATRAADVLNAHDAHIFVVDKIFCILGITSELGPALELLKIPGAHVIGIARGGPKLAKLIEFCQQESPVSTTLQVPENGADLLTDFPAIAEWILECACKDDVCSAKQLVLCMTAYMDGEANVRATVAMDLIVDYILKRRSNVALSCLTSPATVYTIPKEAAEHARKLLPKLSIYSYLTLGKWFRPVGTWDQSDPILLNAIVNLQGPNYCLAKTMQQWRCLLAYSEGIPVSAPHAPPTRTYSVTHNATAATALQGQAYIEPLVSFDVKTCSTLMASILLSHLKNPPSNNTIGHPMELFWDGSVHGGIWRCPVTIESIGLVTYLLGLIAPRKYPQASLADLDEHTSDLDKHTSPV